MGTKQIPGGKETPARQRRWALVAVFCLVAAVAAFWLRPEPSEPRATDRPERHPARRTLNTSAAKAASPQSVDAPAAEPDRQLALRRVAELFAKQARGDAGVDLSKLTDDELLAGLQDESLPLKTLRQMARELARRKTDTAWAALSGLASHANPRVRAIAAEALGYSSRPEAKTLLHALLDDEDLSVVQGAIRGLGASGGADAVGTLAAVLAEPACNPTARAEAALALGAMKSSDAAAALVAAMHTLDDPSMREAVLLALGRQPFSETESFFRAYLDAPDTASSLRVSALESMAGADGAVAPFLLGYTRDPDPQVRAAAAWGLTMAENYDGAGAQLAGLLASESDADVRTRLYQALIMQEGVDFAAVLPIIERESDPDARLAGYNLWASQCSDDRQSAVAVKFDQAAVPQLQQVALNGSDRAEQLSAVIALRRAGSPAAQGALNEIAQNATDPQVVKAARSAVTR